MTENEATARATLAFVARKLESDAARIRANVLDWLERLINNEQRFSALADR